MPRITGTTAPIYNTDLQYERNCKCGTTEVIGAGETFDWEDIGEYGWKMVFFGATVITDGSLKIDNISTADTNTLDDITFANQDEILGKITDFTVTSGCVVVYKDCENS